MSIDIGLNQSWRPHKFAENNGTGLCVVAIFQEWHLLKSSSKLINLEAMHWKSYPQFPIPSSPHAFILFSRRKFSCVYMTSSGYAHLYTQCENTDAIRDVPKFWTNKQSKYDDAAGHWFVYPFKQQCLAHVFLHGFKLNFEFDYTLIANEPVIFAINI